MRGVIFDLDGTLVDSLPGIALALNEALTSHGYDPHPDQAVRSFVGDGILMTCRRALPNGTPEETVSAIAKAHGELYDQLWKEHTDIFPGVPDLLAHLQIDKILTGVCSNKSHAFTKEMVATLFPRIPQAFVAGHRPDTSLKPDPTSALAVARAMDLPPEKVAFVGDSTIDHETADNAGMRPLLVNWGYHDSRALGETGAPILESITALQQALAAPGAA